MAEIKYSVCPCPFIRPRESRLGKERDSRQYERGGMGWGWTGQRERTSEGWDGELDNW